MSYECQTVNRKKRLLYKFSYARHYCCPEEKFKLDFVHLLKEIRILSKEISSGKFKNVREINARNIHGKVF